MSISLSDAVQSASFANLQRVVTGAACYAVVPQTTPPVAPPFVVIGEHLATFEGSKTSEFERHELSVLAVVPAGSRRLMFALMQQVKDALHRQPLTFAGAELSNPILLSSSDQYDDEADLLVGEQRFLIFAQPA